MSSAEKDWRGVDPRSDYNAVVMSGRVCQIVSWDARYRGGCGRQAAVEIRAYMEADEMRARYPSAQERMRQLVTTEAGVWRTDIGNFLIYAIYWPCRDCYESMIRASARLGSFDRVRDSFLVLEVMGPKAGRPYIARGKTFTMGQADDLRVVRTPTTPLSEGDHRGIYAPDGTALVRGNLNPDGERSRIVRA